jgi:outer membrane protein OmpA-like peptidoglycan-associated protein
MVRWIVLAGVAAYLMIGYFATSSQYPTADGLGRRSVYLIAATLQQKAEAAIAKLGAQQWATVVVDGQSATLAGEAPTDADRQDAIDAVRGAEWPGGKWIGGITVVRNATTLAKAVSPYEWTAQLGDRGRVRLGGYVPGQRHRRAIRAEASRLFPQGIEDQMVIAQGAPTGAWTETAIWALAQLSRLSAGEARFTDKVILIRGAAPNVGVETDIEQAAATKVGKPYVGKTDIKPASAFELAPQSPTEPASPPQVAAAASVAAQTPAHPLNPAPSPVTPPTPSPATPPTPGALAPPDAVPATPGQHDNGVDCQKLVDKLMANNTIVFASASSQIRPVALGMLDRLAQSAAVCPLKIRVTGHTDTTQTESADPNLSQARADAVVAYLAEKGVSRKRLVAIGAGADQPVGDNNTPTGQAKNRRIEITVMN